MTGLEKILKAIKDEAGKNTKSIISQANKEADDIIKAAKAKADKKSSDIALKSEIDKKIVLSRAKSAADLLERKMILDAKGQIINEIINNARNLLINLPSKEYFDVILKMVTKHAHNEVGKIAFSKADKERIPKDFISKLKKTLADKDNASLEVSEETATIDGGFVLIYGEIEENCSFDALIAAVRDELQDKVNELLFK